MSMCRRLKRMTPDCQARHCLVEGGAEGVLERGTLETFVVVVDRVFANELHLRFCAGSFESGWRTDFSRLGLIIAMSIRLKSGVKYLREKMTVEGHWRFGRGAYWKTGGMRTRMSLGQPSPRSHTPPFSSPSAPRHRPTYQRMPQNNHWGLSTVTLVWIVTSSQFGFRYRKCQES